MADNFWNRSRGCADLLIFGPFILLFLLLLGGSCSGQSFFDNARQTALRHLADLNVVEGDPFLDDLGMTRFVLGTPVAHDALQPERMFVEGFNLIDPATQAFRFSDIDFVVSKLDMSNCAKEWFICLVNDGDTFPVVAGFDRQVATASPIDFLLPDRFEADVEIPAELGPWKVEAVLTVDGSPTFSKPFYVVPEPSLCLLACAVFLVALRRPTCVAGVEVVKPRRVSSADECTSLRCASKS